MAMYDKGPPSGQNSSSGTSTFVSVVSSSSAPEPTLGSAAVAVSTANTSTSTLTSPITPSPTVTTPAAAQTSTATSSNGTASVDAAIPSSSNTGAIAGGVVGGVVFLVLVAVALAFYLRARKRKRTPPSSEFMNSLKDGSAPVLRLDSGIEYSPALPEKGGGHTHYPPPPPFLQNSYYTTLQDMKFPDEMITSDIPSRRPSIEKPLQPQRFSSQQSDESFVAQHNSSTSVGSKRELWGSDMEIVLRELSPVRQSPSRADSVLQFAPHFSLDEPSPQSPPLSHSPTSLQPLRRRPD